jgi:hypothetical protein
MLAQLQDLCLTCLNEQDCMDRGTDVAPKMFCEHFDVERPTPNPWEKDVDEQWLASEIQSENGAHRGLCANCANRHHCSIAKPEGDIWHCEEYR